MKQRSLHLQSSEPVHTGRRPAVDWYFRGAWILAVLVLLSQFGVMVWLSI